jgi:hypothetical protein
MGLEFAPLNPTMKVNNNNVRRRDRAAKNCSIVLTENSNSEKLKEAIDRVIEIK